MLDLDLIRERPDFVKAQIARLHVEAPIDQILSLDARRRSLLTELEGLRAQVNATSKQIARTGEPAQRQALIEQVRAWKERIPALEQQLREVEAQLYQRMLEVPNLPHEDVPDGLDERDNVVVRTVGEPRVFDFPPKPHWELGAALDILDIERGVKIAGSRFYVLKGLGARLQRALITWMLDLHTQQHGYLEIYPPYLVNSACMIGTGNLPKFGDNLYRDAEEDLWLIPTAEVPVTNLHRDEVLPPGTLPLRYVAYTACFRREKFSAGRDVRGIKRVHQFDKVELVKYCEPEHSDEELQSLIRDAEEVCRLLEIPYRVVQMCTGDLSFVAAIKFDIEMWAPGCQEWLEVSSCSNFRDFQARRANIRYRPAPGEKPRYVHTLNGSGLALPRVFIAVLENYQQADGSVVIPQVLRPYMGGLEVIRPPAA
ncbi:MAG: serine--tRNA ligase [Chloroflexia bacterium]